MLDPYERLANAIILQAVRDWRGAMVRLRKRPNNRDAQDIVNETERFFHSGWFGVLTKLDGDTLLEKLKEEYPV